MKIADIILLDGIVEKFFVKHDVRPHEVEQVLRYSRHYRFVEKGHQRGEDVYSAMGQTFGGRYLIVYFIYKKDRRALVLSSRDMTTSERRRYEKE